MFKNGVFRPWCESNSPSYFTKSRRFGIEVAPADYLREHFRFRDWFICIRPLEVAMETWRVLIASLTAVSWWSWQIMDRPSGWWSHLRIPTVRRHESESGLSRITAKKRARTYARTHARTHPSHTQLRDWLTVRTITIINTPHTHDYLIDWLIDWLIY